MLESTGIMSPRGGTTPMPCRIARAEQVEGDRGQGVDDQRAARCRRASPGSSPRARARHAAVSSRGPREARVALLDAPVRVHEQLGGADAGDAEDGDGGGQPLRPEAAAAGPGARRSTRSTAAMRDSTTAASTVSRVKSATLTMASRSSGRSRRPAAGPASGSRSRGPRPPSAPTAPAGHHLGHAAEHRRRPGACVMTPWRPRTTPASSRRNRGPGTRSKPSRPVSPVAIV